MSEDAETEKSRPVVRRWRARWEWLVGIILAATVAFYATHRWMPRAPGNRPVEPREIRVASNMRPSGVVQVSPGALAGCNLLLVTLDTTRADRIGCYGHEKIKTLALDRLASEGLLFTRAIAPAPTTLPSHASLMTGLYPFHHGVRANGLYQLDEKFETLAEMLSAAGYATGAMLSASVLDSQFGLAQGFRDYDDEIEVPGRARRNRRGTTGPLLTGFPRRAIGISSLPASVSEWTG